MSQVDYLHFFNNSLWNFIQFIIFYLIICLVYVQIFYKIFRLRLLKYKNLNNILQEKNYFFNENRDILNFKSKSDTDFFFFCKLNQKINKCFYE